MDITRKANVPKNRIQPALKVSSASNSPREIETALEPVPQDFYIPSSFREYLEEKVEYLPTAGPGKLYSKTPKAGGKGAQRQSVRFMT